MFEKIFAAFDESLFERFEGLSISLAEPEKDHGNPIISPGAPGSPDAHRAQYNGTIIFHDGRYHMWYVASDHERRSAIAYAVSRDGVNWLKPSLGLSGYKGSNKNNLVSGLPGNTDCISVIRDDDGLFKAAVMGLHGLERKHVGGEFHKHWDSESRSPAFMGIAVSADGLRWEFKEGDGPAIAEKLETCRLAKINGEYLLSGQQAFPWAGREWRGRVVTFFRSKDLKEWRKDETIYQNGTCQCHVGITSIKSLGDTLVGLTGRFQDAPEISDQHFEIGLVISRDGVRWREPAPAQAFIRRGDFGRWDGGGVIQGQGMVEADGMTHIFYSGTRIGNCPFSEMGIGKVSFPENHFGYAALEVKWDLGFRGTRVGSLLTHPIAAQGCDKFFLTLDADNFEKGGLIKAAIVNETGTPLAGYSLEDCDAVKDNGNAVKVSWRNHETITTAKPFKVALSFQGGTYREQSPYLYSFTIKEA